MMHTRPPDEIIRVQATLGESILWDSRRHLLWWTDIHGRRLYRYDWAGALLRVFATPERVGSFGLVAGSDLLVTAFADGIGLFDVAEQSVFWLDRPAMRRGIRFNDGKVDRRGRFWVGTMVEDDAALHEAAACLYSVEGREAARCHVRELRISNGICFSADGKRLYLTDSPTREIRVYDLLEPEGRLGGQRVFARTPDGAYPDGAAIDADGCVWSAHWGAGCVVRYTPKGRVDRILQVPTRQPTCVCFGGPARDVLCITTAREGLTQEVLEREPHAGDVFLYRMGVQGLAEPEYRA
jgi:L-arabinonolactonase